MFLSYLLSASSIAWIYGFVSISNDLCNFRLAVDLMCILILFNEKNDLLLNLLFAGVTSNTLTTASFTTARLSGSSSFPREGFVGNQAFDIQFINSNVHILCDLIQ